MSMPTLTSADCNRFNLRVSRRLAFAALVPLLFTGPAIAAACAILDTDQDHG